MSSSHHGNGTNDIEELARLVWKVILGFVALLAYFFLVLVLASIWPKHKLYLLVGAAIALIVTLRIAYSKIAHGNNTSHTPASSSAHGGHDGHGGHGGGRGLKVFAIVVSVIMMIALVVVSWGMTQANFTLEKQAREEANSDTDVFVRSDRERRFYVPLGTGLDTIPMDPNRRIWVRWEGYAPYIWQNRQQTETNRAGCYYVYVRGIEPGVTHVRLERYPAGHRTPALVGNR